MAASAETCKDAPPVPRRIRPSAIGVFDPITGAVRRTAVVGDAIWAAVAGDVVITEAGDGWLRGIELQAPTEVIWCLRLAASSDLGLGPEAAGIVAVGPTVVVASGRDVLGVDANSGAIRWKAPIAEAISGLSAGKSQIYVSTTLANNGSVTALNGLDGTVAWHQVVSPCAITSGPSSATGPAAQACFVPVGPGKVIESGSLLVLSSPNDRQVKAFDIATGLIRWHIDASAPIIAASGDIALVYGRDTAELAGFGQDGRRIFTVSASGHAIAGDEAGAFVLDQGVGQAGSPQVGPPPSTTALVARRADDGTTLWRVEVPGLPQTIGVADGLLITSSGRDIAAVRAADGSVAWHASLVTPATTGSFSVTGSWNLLGLTSEGIVLIAAAEHPYRD